MCDMYQNPMCLPILIFVENKVRILFLVDLQTLLLEFSGK